MSRRITLLLLLTLFTYAVLWAQNSNNYTFTTGTNGSFEDLSSGSTQLHGPSSGALAQRASFSLSDFDFFMMGSRYGIFNVGSNGLIDLNTGNFNIPNNGLFHAGQTRLAAFSVLTNSNARVVTSASGKVHYKLVGNAPNRCLVIEFLNMQLGIAGSQTATWQVKLYETTGVVEMVYGAMGANGNLSDVQIGLANGNTAGQYISIATATQTASTSAITNNSYSQSTLSDLDSPNEGSRRFYRFTPIMPQAPAGISITNPTSGTLTLSLQASPTPEAYRFVIYRASQPGGPFLYHTLSTSNSFTDINLSANTTYYYQVRAITEGGVSSAVTVNGTTLNNGHIRAKATGGDWSSASTWEGDVVPSRNDTVTIPAGTTVNINTTASCATLTNHGRLPFTANTSLSVFGDLVNSATGSITAEASGSRGIFLYDGHLTNAGTLDFSMTSNYISINLNQSKSFTNSGTIVGTDASGTPANTPIIRRFTINTSVSPVNPIPATLTLNFPLIISENLNLGYGFISNSQPITFDNTQVKPGTAAGSAVGVIHFGGSTTGILGPVAFGANATYNVQYSNTYATGVQIAGNELPGSFTVNSITVGNSAGLQLSGPVQALQLSGQPILLNGHHLTIGRSVSQPGSLGNTVFAPGTVTRWFGTNTISEGNSAGSINFAVGTPASFQNRFVNISSSQITQGGTITLAHVEAAGQTNFDTPFFENLYGYVRRSNSYWELSTGNGFAAGELMLRLGAQGLQGNEPAPFVATNISLANGAAPGTFTTAVNFSTYPVVRRLLPGHSDLQQRFYIAERDPILPLNSLRLQGRLQQGIASLEWFTTGEQRLSHFEVERSNGSSFETIGRVTARNGHSQAYQFADARPPRGSLLYRLRVVDQDGAFRYSPVLAMQHKDNQGWQLQQNYPNPARGTTRIAYQVAETAALSLQVLDTEGRQVQLLPLGRQQPGQYNVELNTCQLRPGIYRYRLLTSGMNTLTSLIQTMVVL